MRDTQNSLAFDYYTDFVVKSYFSQMCLMDIKYLS